MNASIITRNHPLFHGLFHSGPLLSDKALSDHKITHKTVSLQKLFDVGRRPLDVGLAALVAAEATVIFIEEIRVHRGYGPARLLRSGRD